MTSIKTDTPRPIGSRPGPEFANKLRHGDNVRIVAKVFNADDTCVRVIMGDRQHTYPLDEVEVCSLIIRIGDLVRYADVAGSRQYYRGKVIAIDNGNFIIRDNSSQSRMGQIFEREPKDVWHDI